MVDAPIAARDNALAYTLRCVALQGATDKMLAAAEACYANDFGCSLRQLGLREMITENRSWDSGGHPRAIFDGNSVPCQALESTVPPWVRSAQC